MSRRLTLLLLALLLSLPATVDARPEPATPAPATTPPTAALPSSTDAVRDLLAAGEQGKAAALLLEAIPQAPPAEQTELLRLAIQLADHFSQLGRKQRDERRYREAIASLKTAGRLNNLVPGDERLGTLASDIYMVAICQKLLHDDTAALKTLTRLMEIFADIDSPLLADLLEERGKLYLQMSRPREAQQDLQRACELLVTKQGEKSTKYENCLRQLATASRALARTADAERQLQELLALQKSRPATRDNEARVADTLTDLGDLQRSTGRFAAAEQHYRAALAIAERQYPDDPAAGARAVQALGRNYQASGQQTAAESTFKRLVAITAADPVDAAKALATLANYYYQMSRYDDAIATYRSVVDQRRQLFGTASYEVYRTQQDLANVLRDAGRHAEAEQTCRKALDGFEQLQQGKGSDYADALDDLARLYNDWGKFTQAEAAAKEALGIVSRLRGKEDSATVPYRETLLFPYLNLGRLAEAEECARQNLAIIETQYGKSSLQYIPVVKQLGRVLRNQGRYDEALAAYRQALEIAEGLYGAGNPLTMGERYWLGRILALKGETAAAEAEFRQVLADCEATYGPDNDSLCETLENLAFLCMDSGRFSEAKLLLERLQGIYVKLYGAEHRNNAYESLAIFSRRTGDYVAAEANYRRSLKITTTYFGTENRAYADTLNNLAWLYYSMGDYPRAESHVREALAVFRRFYGGDHVKSTNSLFVLGMVFIKTGKLAEAEQLFERARQLSRDANLENSGPAWGLGELYLEQRRYDEALPNLQEGLRIATRERDTETVWQVQNAISLLMERQQQTDAAIFFAKLAVNTIQKVRGDIAKLDSTVQASYRDMVTPVYRRLADLLISQGRLPEAQQVMELLKQQEYSQFVRRDARETAQQGNAPLTLRESTLDRDYQRSAAELARLASERSLLAGKRNRTPEEEQRLAELTREHGQAVTAYNQAFAAITTGLAGNRADKVEELKEAEGLMAVLKELKHGSVAVYTLVGEKTFRCILITPRFRRAYEYPIGVQELNRKIARFRELLTDPELDPRPAGKELYDIIVAPLAEGLMEAKAQTIMWSLDGALRYLPVAALHDGSQYLLERYRNVVFTPISQANLKDTPTAAWKGLALGVSKPHPGFAPLPSVPSELAGVIRSDTGSLGALPGEMHLDDQFTWQVMEQGLRQEEAFPLVHIASHFQFTPGDDTMSFLLLGDGKKLTISDLRQQEALFAGVELLTLSACETAVGDLKSADGREVEGFAVLAQRKGAKAVVATLWPVADESTAGLMQTFYRLREEQRLPKGEALRQAQLSLLNGTLPAATTVAAGQRNGSNGEKPLRTASARPFRADPEKPFAHPYFWAPFILLGNWK